MNLYLLFAIALGAISGASEAPVARPAFAAVVAKSGVRAERQVVRVEAGHSCLPPAQGQARVPVLHGARVDAPLTGAGTPRAPSA
jgi:hypothetical protein